MPHKDRATRLAYLSDWQDKNGERMAEWEAANRERRLAQKRQWRLDNSEHVREYNAAYRKSHPATVGELRARYYHGLEQGEIEELYAAQGGRCAICDVSRPMRGFGCLCIDHDHGTGERRGLICKPCNTALNSVEKYGGTWVLRALAYLGNPPLRHLRKTSGKTATATVDARKGDTE